MTLLSQIEAVIAHLKGKGIAVELEIGSPVQEGELSLCAERLGIQEIPEGIRRFYQGLGDGLYLRWVSGENQGAPFANFSVVPIGLAIDAREKEKSYHPIWDDGFPYAGCKSPALARLTALDSRHYLNVIDEGNGDAVAVDLRFGIVRFNRHDWFDGGIGHNGWIMEADLTSFLTTWSQRCFQVPKSLSWGSVLTTYGVDWNSSDFDRDYSLKNFVWS